jgi:hypothetical protein
VGGVRAVVCITPYAMGGAGEDSFVAPHFDAATAPVGGLSSASVDGVGVSSWVCVSGPLASAESHAHFTEIAARGYEGHARTGGIWWGLDRRGKRPSGVGCLAGLCGLCGHGGACVPCR